jgi:orotate phosphoribosyltransferase
MTPYFERIRQIVMDPAVLTHTVEPIRLASGEMSRDFIDGKLAVDDPDDLDYVGAAMFHAASSVGIEFDAVGGLVLGAVPFAFAVAEAARCKWFMIRKESKGRGTNRRIEGARIQPGMRVMVVDDVVTTGGSIRDAYDHVVEEGGCVVFATTLVDRGDSAAAYFASVGVPYVPMLTYSDLDIEPVGHEPRSAAAVS